jgi:DNA-binding transcriptional ArsR family regulator
MERTSHLLTPSSLKALAHPIRVELLALLRTDGPSTATALADRIGESSGSTSYHLRQLHAADLVAEETGRGNGRERWWRAAQDSTRLEVTELDDDPATQHAAELYLSEVGRAYAERLRQWLDSARRWPKRWRSAATMSDFLLSLSPAELTRLGNELEQLVESYRRERRKGDESVVVQVQAFPFRRDS